MKPITDFIQAYQTQFNRKDLHKTVFRLGDRAMNKKARVNMAFHKTRRIMDLALSGKAIWIVLISWNTPEQTQHELSASGFELSLFQSYSGTPSDGVVDYTLLKPVSTTYLYLDTYNSATISPLYKSILRYDLNIPPCTPAQAYFLSFENHPILLNPYDDRGLELLTPNASYQEALEKPFASYVLSSTADL